MISFSLSKNLAGCAVGIAVMSLFAWSTDIARSDELGIGESLYGQRDYRTAARFFEDSVHTAPGNAVAHYYLANCYAALREYGAAEKEYQRVIELEPNSSEGRLSNSAIARLHNYRVLPTSAPDGSASPVSTYPQPLHAPATIATTSSGSDSGKDLLDQYQRHAKQVIDDAERECKKIDLEEAHALADAQRGYVLIPGGNRIAASPDELAAIEAEYELKKTNIRADSKREAAKILNESSKITTSMHDSARNTKDITATIRASAPEPEQKAPQSELQKTVTSVSKVTDEHEQAVVAPYKLHAQQILDDADRQCKAIQAEEAEALKPVLTGGYRMEVRYRAPYGQEAEDIKAPYEAKLLFIRTDAEKRVASILDEGKRAALAVQQSASGVERRMIDPSSTAPTVIPTGSGLYVRQFLTPDHPSGNPIQLISSPKKLSETPKKSAQP